jgi:HSP20 family protein
MQWHKPKPHQENITMTLVRYNYPTYRSFSPFAFQRSPWAGLEAEIDRLFDTAVTSFDGSSTGGRFAVDLYEDEANTYVRAELPGINRDDLTVEMTDGTLTISVASRAPAASKKSNDEAASGDEAETAEETFSFTRSITIPDEVQSDKVSAAYENGVLTVTLPKREEVKPKKITVSVK